MKSKFRLIEIVVGLLFVAGSAHGQSIPTNGLQMWLRADGGVTSGTGGQVSAWADQSGNGNGAAQTISGCQPVLVSSSINGLPSVHFTTGAGQYMTLPNFMASGTAGEIFGVVKAANTTANNICWYFGTGSPDWYVFAPNGGMYGGFGSSAQYGESAPPQNITQFHLLDECSQPGAWSSWVDGIPYYQRTSNTVAFTTAPYIGCPGYSSGDVAEVLVYNRPLSSAERLEVEQYLNGRYGMAAPTRVTATPVSSSQVALTWTASEQSGIEIQRMTGTSGTYSPLVALNGSATTYVDETATAGVQYSYAISVTSTMGNSAYLTAPSVTPPSGIPPVPTGGMNLWLAAGVGVTTASSGSNHLVSAWADLSGSGNNAIQSGTANQPVLAANGLNGEPALTFNGTNSYMSLGTALNSGSALPLTVVIVTASNSNMQGAFDSAPGQVNTFRFYSNFVEAWSQSPYVTLAPPATGAITSVVAKTNGGGDRQLNVYVNGAEVGAATGNNSPVLFSNPQIGRINASYYYGGNIAEVLVYNQALSGTARQAVEAYLNAKYGIVSAPSAPTDVTVQQTNPTENLITWSTGANGVETTYQIWRQEGSGGWVLAGTVTGNGTFIDSGLDSNGAYSYEVLATNIGGTSGFSSVVASNADSGTSAGSIPVNGMQLWLMADGAWESPLGYWQDYSGNGNSAWQETPAYQPTVTGSALNGEPVVHFSASAGQYLALPDFISSGTAGEIFGVVRTSSTTANGIPWQFGSGSPDWYVFGPNGDVYSGFGAATEFNEGIPVQNITQFHLYEESSEPGWWESWLDGVPFYWTSSNTVGFTHSPLIGYPGNFTGDIAEVIVYNRPLSDAERKSVTDYLNQKYGMETAPATPTGLQAVALSSTANLVNWNAPVANSEVDYQVWRLQDSGTWTQIVDLANVCTYVDSAGDGTATYKVLAMNSAGSSAFTEEVPVITTDTQQGNFPTAGLQLWLMADGAWENPVGYLPDYSGNGNNAWQNGPTASKPTVSGSALNGKPTIHFTGTSGQYLSLPDFLSSGTAGEIIAVVKASNATSNNGLWDFGTGAGEWYPFASTGNVYGDFGSAAQQNEGVATVNLTQFHVYDESSQAGLWASWMDGVPIYATGSNTVSFPHAPLLGYGGYGYFAGDVAEVMVYNRPLASIERTAILQYLADKYGFSGISNFIPGQVDPGSGFVSDSGTWTVSGSNIINGQVNTVNRRGSIDYSFSVPSAGIWGFQITAQAVGSVAGQNIDIPIEVLVDGVNLGNYTLHSYNGSIGYIEGLSQELQAGTHDLEIVNMNYSGTVDLQIDDVAINQPEGACTNGNGLPDWLNSQIVAEDTVNPVPATSYVSPVCIEGGARLSGEPVITSGTSSIAPISEMNSQWYANIPLNADGPPTAFTAAFEGGLISSTNTVSWSPLNLLAASGTTMTIRTGDSLLLTDYPVGTQPDGSVAITIASGSNVIYSGSTTADAPVPYQFVTSGTYSVQANWNGGGTAAITVAVKSADFGNPLFAYVGDVQTWQMPGVDPGLTVQWDNNISITENTPPSTGGCSFQVTPEVTGTLYGVARLYPGGPILARAEVDSYGRYSTFATGDTHVVGTNPDGSQLVQGSIVIDALPPGGYAEIVLFIGGESFPDGSGSEILTASDFTNGVATFEVDWANTHSICHYILIYNAQGQVVGSL